MRMKHDQILDKSIYTSMDAFAEVKDDLFVSPVVFVYSDMIPTHGIEAFEYQIVSKNSW